MKTTVKKTKKYYREELLKGNVSESLLKEAVKKFGEKKQIKDWKTGVTHTDYVLYVDTDGYWNHRIINFEFTRHKKLYVDIYWQGDKTDGDEIIEASKLISRVRSGNDYVIPAEWDDVGGEWGKVCRHSPINISKEEFDAAMKKIAEKLMPDSKKKK